MICWAKTALPSSRVRSAALRTYLFKRALDGLRVIGTVSGSFGLVFFLPLCVGVLGLSLQPSGLHLEQERPGQVRGQALLQPAGGLQPQYAQPGRWNCYSFSCSLPVLRMDDTWASQ